jgi:hypothetical protein
VVRVMGNAHPFVNKLHLIDIDVLMLPNENEQVVRKDVLSRKRRRRLQKVRAYQRKTAWRGRVFEGTQPSKNLNVDKVYKVSRNSIPKIARNITGSILNSRL